MLSVVDFSRVKRLLYLGAHCDDIEIGAGALSCTCSKNTRNFR
jgi:hypothetical protein